MFEIKLKDQTIPLKWGIWSIKRFTEISNKGLKEYFEILGNGEFPIEVIIWMLQAGAEYGYIKSNKEVDFSEVDICEWIDECGGINGDQIRGFFEYMVSTVVSNVTTVNEDKKKVKKS